MDLNDYKLYSLQQAAQRASAPAVQGGNGLDQLLGQQQPAVNVTTPNVTEPKPGPIRSFLSNFLYGAGQGMLSKVGLETDAQKEQRQIQQQTAQQNAQTQELYRQAYATQVGAQNQPVDLSSFGIEGLTGIVPQRDVAKVVGQHVAGLGKAKVAQTAADARTKAAEIAADAAIENTKLKYGTGANGEPGGALSHIFKDVNGRSLMIDRRTGQPIRDLGPSNSIATAQARARAMAEYALTPTIDDEGNPTSTSRLSALEGGTPQVGFPAARQLSSDRVGIQQYEDILSHQIAPNLSVLNDSTQRAIIAHTLAQGEKNPGAIQSLLTSAAQQGLTPQGAALAAGILQGREFGNVARKYGGNMNGTEGLMNRIMSNQASPLNAEQLNRDLIQNDLAFTAKAKGALGGLTKRGVKSQPASTPSASPAATHRFNPATGKIEVIQ